MLDTLSPREVAKFVATCLVGSSVAYGTDHAIEATTDIDTDNIVVDAGTTVFGAIVAVKLRPYTDRLVDAGANRWQRRKENRQNKKNAEKTES
jgi:hypothetical protein